MDISYLLPDIPRYLTALAEWLACLMCIIEVKKRLTGWKVVFVSAGALVVQTVFLFLTAEFENLFWILTMLAAVGLMYVFLRICCSMNCKDVVYYCVRAFVVAEFAASLEWQLDCFFRFAAGMNSLWFRVGLFILSFGAVYLLVWVLYRRFSTKEELQVTNRELISCIIIGTGIFAISNLGFTSITTPFGGEYMSAIFNARTLIDLGGVAILYAYHVQRVDLRTRQELESMQSILHNQYVQYQQSREAMELIDYKYHDLKHHIIALRAEENSEKRNEYLDNMEKELKNYEGQNRTGNQVLDTLLTAKNLYCLKCDISMTCVVDGTLFGFMDVMDICSIFGNALDNAIECERRIQEREKRLIHVTAVAQKSFIIIKVENYYEGELEYEENLPLTTKKESQFHGYGLKSIQYTARKYGGEVDVSVQDDWFNLRVLIPMEMEMNT